MTLFTYPNSNQYFIPPNVRGPYKAKAVGIAYGFAFRFTSGLGDDLRNAFGRPTDGESGEIGGLASGANLRRNAGLFGCVIRRSRVQLHGNDSQCLTICEHLQVGNEFGICDGFATTLDERNLVGIDDHKCRSFGCLLRRLCAGVGSGHWTGLSVAFGLKFGENLLTNLTLLAMLSARYCISNLQGFIRKILWNCVCRLCVTLDGSNVRGSAGVLTLDFLTLERPF